MGKFSPLQPPPSLPRRGGTVTIDYLIICRRLIISHLSANGVIFISPTGENERGLKMITGIIHLHLKSAFVMPLVIVVAKNHEQMCDVCRSLAVGECWLLEKSLQKCPKCPTVPLSQVESCILYKLLYINILSFLLHLFFVIWDNGTLGQVGQVGQFCKEFYSLFPLSLAISLRSTLTISLVIIAILFSRTGKELCRIQLVGDV